MCLRLPLRVRAAIAPVATAVSPARTWTARKVRKTGAVEPTCSPRILLADAIPSTPSAICSNATYETTLVGELPGRKASSSVATHEGGSAEGALGCLAARRPGRRAEARVRRHGGIAGVDRRPARFADRDDLSGPAPAGGRGLDRGLMVHRRRPPAPVLYLDRCGRRRAAQATCRLAELRRRDECGPRGHAMAEPSLIANYKAVLLAELPLPLAEEVSDGLAEAYAKYLRLELGAEDAAQAAVSEFG